MYESPHKELEDNINTIKQCKIQTEQFLTDMHSKLDQQNLSISQIVHTLKREREQTKMYRNKYYEAMRQLRKKEEEKEGLDRKLQ